MNGATGSAADDLRYVRPDDLPDFERPPVTEVTIALHFLPPLIRTVHFGLLYERFKGRYPIVEERPPIVNQVEDFAGHQPSPVQFKFLDTPPVPLVVFMASDRSSLVQLQADRFQCAWRRPELGGGSYPHYSALRTAFLDNANELSAFATEQGWPDFGVVQAEIGYVNDVPLQDGRSPAELVDLLPAPSPHSVIEQQPDMLQVAERYTFRTADDIPYARLHVEVVPGLAPTGPATRLALTFRGEPFTGRERGSPLASVMHFLDEGHDWIVRLFAQVTNSEMHTVWGRLK